MMRVTTRAQAPKAIRLYEPMRAKTSDGKPKIPAPIIPLIAIATRSQRRMPRTSPSFVLRADTFSIGVPYNLNSVPTQSFRLDNFYEVKNYASFCRGRFGPLDLTGGSH